MPKVYNNYLTQYINERTIKIEWVSTKKEWADIMTKPLD